MNARARAAAATVLLASSVAPAQAPPPLAQRLAIASKVLGEERTLFVWTPPTYARTDARYPVLYLTDGDAHLLHTIASIEFQARQGIVPELIVVAVASPDRRRDLAPAAAGRGADRFVKFFADELIPWVDRRYRTRPFRVLAGHSLGGLFAVHVLETRGELFGGYIASSPSLGWDHRLPLRRFQEMLQGDVPIKASLFVSKGVEDDDTASAVDTLVALVESAKPAGLAFTAMDFPDEDHGSVVLRSYYHGLRAIFSGWRAPVDVVGGGLEAARAHYRALSGRVGYEVPVPEYLLEAIGRRQLRGEDTGVAIETFLFAVASYPRSAEAHDGLGAAFERAGDESAAIEHYGRAWALAREAGDPRAGDYKERLDRARAAAARKR